MYRKVKYGIVENKFLYKKYAIASNKYYNKSIVRCAVE